jgi:hypothetical protein
MEKDIIVAFLKKWKEKIFENWIITIAVLSIFVAINLLVVRQNLITNEIYYNEIPIFKTYKTLGNCFYQKRDSKKWLFLSGEEILSTGSELQTDADAHAILSFFGQNGRVELSEKTHLGILKQGKDTIIDFKKGEVYINYQSSNALKPLLVKINQKTFKMTNADLYIRGDPEEGVEVSVEYGRTIMMTGKESNAFEKGQTIFFKSEKEYSVEESKFKITTPFNYDRYHLEENKFDVRFAFTAFEKDYDLQLLAGPSPEKLSPVFDKPKRFSKNEFFVPFEKGTYYWQLIAYEGKTPIIYSNVKKFFIEIQSLIQLVKPLLNAKFQLIDDKATVQFQWDNPSQLEKVFIEISNQKDFSKTLVNESIPENNYFNYEFENIGEYYWRVSGFPFGTSDLLQSSIGKVNIVSEVVPQQVKILFPKQKSVLTTLSLKNSDVTFQWSKNPTTAMYTVEMKSLKDGKISSYATSDTQIKINDLSPGMYEWKVSDKKSALVSETEQFSVIQTKRLNFSQGGEEIGYLSWQQGPRGTAHYRVEALRIGSRSDFNAFFDQSSSTKKSLEINGDKISYKNFSDGIYAFKVYALDAEKNILADSNLKFLKVGQRTNP